MVCPSVNLVSMINSFKKIMNLVINPQQRVFKSMTSSFINVLDLVALTEIALSLSSLLMVLLKWWPIAWLPTSIYLSKLLQSSLNTQKMEGLSTTSKSGVFLNTVILQTLLLSKYLSQITQQRSKYSQQDKEKANMNLISRTFYGELKNSRVIRSKF